ncbi:MAG TPA: hypothetical protein VN688_06155 [Gemmataceae bacterium]|nr:hypothetical protein [Gemmataceae bacterium]
MPARLYPLLLIPLLGLLFFHDLVLHPNRVLYSDHSDLIALHLPAKRFLVHSWRETGELPLWCPYQCAGEPFIHDSLAAVFYPPHLLFLLLPEEHAGMALSWLVVLHVVVAGWCMVAYGREQGLNETAALVAAVGYMFAGAWLQRMLLGGHYLLIGLAWLPLVLLLLERAVRRLSLAWATAAGGIYGLLILGTAPQFTFYASLFVALWTLGAALDRAGWWDQPLEAKDGGRPRSRRLTIALACWLGYGLWTALVGVGLAAVQLLPTMEAAQQSSRALGIGFEKIAASGLQSILSLVGPALTTNPVNVQGEDRGGLTLLWLFAAVIAGWLGRGRLRYQAGVTVLLLIFAVGGAVIMQRLPGFRLFPQPTRLFVILSLPVALLAGAATQMLFAGDSPTDRLRRCRRILVRLLCALAILSGGFALRQLLDGKFPCFHIYWVSLLLTVPAAFWVLGQTSPSLRRRGVLLWSVLLLIDLWALTMPLVDTRPEQSFYPSSSCVDLLIGQRGEPGRILDRDDHPGGSGTPLGAGAPLAMIYRLESLRGYNSLDTLRYKEYLQFASGSNAPLQTQSGPLTHPILGDFPIVHKRLLDLLGVRYLVQPSVRPPEQKSEWRAVRDDPQPEAFDFIAGGVRELPSYTVWENRTVLPRAFVVFRAAPLPERSKVLHRLIVTDFREEVLLEGDVPPSSPVAAAASVRRATLRRYEPNRVVVEVEPGRAGWLVLADLWYPGWTCRIDDNPVTVKHADYLFRAVAVPEGRREVVFAFEPASYRWGRGISILTLGILAGVLTLAVVLRFIRRKRYSTESRSMNGPGSRR